MKKFLIRHNRGWLVEKNHKQAKTRVTYIAPIHPNDLKRVGQELVVDTGSVRFILNGKQIQRMKTVFRKMDAEKIDARKRKSPKEIVTSMGKNWSIYYSAPTNSNDRKRSGIHFSIYSKTASFMLNAKQVSSIRKVLEKVS